MPLQHIYKYNLVFSNINSEYYNDPVDDIFGNRIIILKRVKSLKTTKENRKRVG
jgi:hypothetical protein